MEIKKQAAPVQEIKKPDEAKQEQKEEVKKDDYYSQKLNAADVFVKQQQIAKERSLPKLAQAKPKASTKAAGKTSLKSNETKSFAAQKRENVAQVNSGKTKSSNVLTEMSRIKNDDNSDIGPSEGA